MLRINNSLRYSLVIIMFFVWLLLFQSRQPNVLLTIIFTSVSFLLTIFVLWFIFSTSSKVNNWIINLSRQIGQFIALFSAKLFNLTYYHRNGNLMLRRFVLTLILSFDYELKCGYIFQLIKDDLNYEDIYMLAKIVYDHLGFDDYSQILDFRNLPRNLSRIPLADLWAFFYKSATYPNLSPVERDVIYNNIFKRLNLFDIQDKESYYLLINMTTKDELEISRDTIPLRILKLIEFNKVAELELSADKDVLSIASIRL